MIDLRNANYTHRYDKHNTSLVKICDDEMNSLIIDKKKL